MALISRADLATVIEEHPGIARAVWRRNLADGLIARQWMLSLGVRDAYARAAHLLCELLTRYEMIGLTKDGGCELCLTQLDLADALGLSIVHVNRVLQRLRADGLIKLQAKHLQVLDRGRLEGAADFDPAYLRPNAPPGLTTAAGSRLGRVLDGDDGTRPSFRARNRAPDEDNGVGRPAP